MGMRALIGMSAVALVWGAQPSHAEDQQYIQEARLWTTSYQNFGFVPKLWTTIVVQ